MNVLETVAAAVAAGASDVTISSCSKDERHSLRLCPIPVRLGKEVVNNLDLEGINWLEVAPADRSFNDGAFNRYDWLAERSWLTAGPCFCLPQPLLRSPARLGVREMAHSFDVHHEESRFSVFAFLDGEIDVANYRELGETREQQAQRQRLPGAQPEPLAHEFSNSELVLETEHLMLPANDGLLESVARSLWFWLGPRGLRTNLSHYQAVFVGARIVSGCAGVLQPCLRHSVKLDEFGATESVLRSILIADIQCEHHHDSLPAMRVGSWVGLRAVPAGPSRLLYVVDGVLQPPVLVSTHYPGSVAILARPTGNLDKDLAWFREQEERLAKDCSADVHSVSAMELYRVPQSIRDAWRPLV